MIENSNLKLEHAEILNSGDGLNWYVYCNNNPLRFVDPTGLFNIGGIIYGASTISSGVGKIAFGGAIIGASGAGAVFTGGTATPVAILGGIAGAAFIANGWTEANTGTAIVAAALVADSDDDSYQEIPTSLTQMLGIVGDEVIEGITGEETDVLETLGEIAAIPPVLFKEAVAQMVLNPEPLDAPGVGNDNDPYTDAVNAIDQEAVGAAEASGELLSWY